MAGLQKLRLEKNTFDVCAVCYFMAIVEFALVAILSKGSKIYRLAKTWWNKTLECLGITVWWALVYAVSSIWKENVAILTGANEASSGVGTDLIRKLTTVVLVLVHDVRYIHYVVRLCFSKSPILLVSTVVIPCCAFIIVLSSDYS